MIYFISGHLSLTQDEFDTYYKSLIDEALSHNHSFVVGDAKGADTLAQKYLFGKTDRVVVYHMFETPRYNAGFPTEGRFQSDEERDIAMTNNSDSDIAWVRKGREKSGTQKNLDRRSDLKYHLLYLGGDR
jgi:hypothetical protein